MQARPVGPVVAARRATRLFFRRGAPRMFIVFLLHPSRVLLTLKVKVVIQSGTRVRTACKARASASKGERTPPSSTGVAGAVLRHLEPLGPVGVFAKLPFARLRHRFGAPAIRGSRGRRGGGCGRRRRRREGAEAPRGGVLLRHRGDDLLHLLGFSRRRRRRRRRRRVRLAAAAAAAAAACCCCIAAIAGPIIIIIADRFGLRPARGAAAAAAASAGRLRRSAPAPSLVALAPARRSRRTRPESCLWR